MVAAEVSARVLSSAQASTARLSPRRAATPSAALPRRRPSSSSAPSSRRLSVSVSAIAGGNEVPRELSGNTGGGGLVGMLSGWLTDQAIRAEHAVRSRGMSTRYVHADGCGGEL